ncbi:alpha/beta hydrolase family protein [Parvularcula maris]|uniref:Alpha/beta fold hydrolase n=1 Tax=Parvularcula maris TaxID=2965077 RepID=A0A9X2L785_9PROT|nr:alpha/beta fold hydrolase [Parvularcula maris]MCQ8184317.1 alpha/beta fold hydrolase [Parvularcula maris]
MSFVDPDRPSWSSDGPRPVTTTLWYPANASSEMSLVEIPSDRPIFVGGFAARNAAIAEERAYPLVLLSHGTGGSGLQMMWLGRALAEQGYIAAAVDHHGNTAAEERYDPRGFRMPWHRAQDLSVVIDRLLEDEQWGSSIDQENVAAAGFSLGGYTVTALAGGLTDLDRLASFCAGPERDATCEPQSEYPDAEEDFVALLEHDPALDEAIRQSQRDFSDPRITRFALLGPALLQAFTDDSLRAIEASVLVIGGGDDDIAPVATNAKRLADLAPEATLHVAEGANHYAFLDPCTARGRRFVPACADGGASRQSVHEETIALLLDFLSEE